MSAHTRASEGDVSVHQNASDAMSRGLHHATQPLSVLQGTLELALLTATTVHDFKKAIERSLEELRRVTDSFEQLRTLAHLQKPASDITTFAASSMVTDVLASLRVDAASAKVEFLQMKLDDGKGSGQDRVRMSRSRISAALKMALSDLLPLLNCGSRLIVSTEPEASDVLIRVDAVNPDHQESQPTQTPARLMTSRQELAQEMTAIAGGELTLYPRSSGVLMRLPKLPLSGGCSEVEHLKAEVSSCLV